MGEIAETHMTPADFARRSGLMTLRGQIIGDRITEARHREHLEAQRERDKANGAHLLNQIIGALAAHPALAHQLRRALGIMESNNN